MGGGKIIRKIAVPRALRVLVMLLFTVFLTGNCVAQRFPLSRPIAGQDSLDRSSGDTTRLVLKDTIVNISSSSALEDSLGIRISPDALDDVVTATATDSAVADLKANLFLLYGSVTVKHEDVTLEAGKVLFDQSRNIILASPQTDTSTSENTFTQNSEKVVYDSLQYNFRSKRAIVWNANSQYGEGFVRSEQIKRNPDESIYGYRNRYTTCALDAPHFAIRANKIKIIPNKIIIAGSANIEIEGVPTPVFLPFAVFPISETQRSGFQLPSYTIEQSRGLGLTNGGYYFYLNDYVDLLLLGNIYSKGSWNASMLSSYANRYHYNGRFSLSYAYNKNGEVYEPGSSVSRQYAVVWQHATDPKARPGETFNANVNVSSSNYYSQNSYNATQIVQNQFLSNVTYAKVWQNKPYNFSAALRHSQNNSTKEMTVTLPQINFGIAQLTPFRRKNPVGKERWYEKITATYNLSGVNESTFIADSSFKLDKLGLNDFNNGLTQSIPVSASYTLLRYINFNASVNYTEYWNTKQQYQYYNRNLTKYDTVVKRGFFTARDFSTTASFGTRLYGMRRFKRGKIKAIRHVLEPSVNYNYTPDFSASPFGYYYTDTNVNGAIEYRSPYATSPVGQPGLGQYGNFRSSVGFGINNNLQVKVRTKDSSGEKKVSIIDGFSINSAYNIAADSFKWSPVVMNFRTTITNIVSVSAGASYDLYDYDHLRNRRSTRTVFDEGNGIARFTNANISLQSNFQSKQRSGNPTVTQKSDEFSRLMRQGGYNDYIDFNVPWSVHVSYALTANKIFRSLYVGKDTVQFAQNLQFNGDFNLTPRWKVTFSSGYDFTNKSLTITSIDIYRDLHCWEMRLGTIPFGLNKSFTFTLNVKAAILQDLRLLRRRDYRDAVY